MHSSAPDRRAYQASIVRSPPDDLQNNTMNSHGENNFTSEGAVSGLSAVPLRVREVAMLRGLGYSHSEIASELNLTRQAVSVMLVRCRRPLKSIRQSMGLLGLSARAVNVLGRHGIENRDQARGLMILDLIQDERNCGRKTIDEIRRWMNGDAAGDCKSCS